MNPETAVTFARGHFNKVVFAVKNLGYTLQEVVQNEVTVYRCIEFLKNQVMWLVKIASMTNLNITCYLGNV